MSLMSRSLESYAQATDFLFGRINYERAKAGSFSTRDFKLGRMRQLLLRLGDPQLDIPAIHIAGTKGKGSTAAMVAAALSASGYRTGLFTSPHLSRFEERMTVDGNQPSEQEVVNLVNEISVPVGMMDAMSQRSRLTFFEIVTAMAWRHFTQRDVQLAVMEVGLGGRLDATNVCQPVVGAITHIGRDHTALLGETPAEIAREKAGIVKPGVPIVSGVTNAQAFSVIEEVCRENGSRLIQLGRDMDCVVGKACVDVVTPFREWRSVPVALLGKHQAMNTAVAIGVLDVLRSRGWDIQADLVHEGLRKLKWPLRIEVLKERPTVIVDAAHNTDSVSALIETLNSGFRFGRRILIFAASKDKEVRALLKLLVPEFDLMIMTRYERNPRAVHVDVLAELVGSIGGGPVRRTESPLDAWNLAEQMAKPDDLICVTGSFFLAAEMRELILGTTEQSSLPVASGV